MNDVVRHLDAIGKSWLEQTGIPENLALMGLADISKQDVTDTLTDLARMAAKLSGAAAEDMVMTRRSCEETIRVAEFYLAEYLKNHQAIHILGFLTLLNQVRVALVGALAQHLQMTATNKPNTSQAA